MTVHRCPTCRTRGRHYGFDLAVDATVACRVYHRFPTDHTKEVKTYVLVPGNEPSWSGDSTMQCNECGHVDKAANFVSEYFPDCEPLQVTL